MRNSIKAVAAYCLLPVLCRGFLLLLSRIGSPRLGPWLLIPLLFPFWNKCENMLPPTDPPASVFAPPASVPDRAGFAGILAVCLAAVTGFWLCSGLIPRTEPDRSLTGILTSVLAAPLWEELLYRGLLLQKRMIRAGDLTALLLSSVFFAAAHPGWYGMAAAGVFALVQGLVLLKYRSLLLPLLIHMLVNAAAYLAPPANRAACLPALILPAGLITCLAVSVFGRKSERQNREE